MLERVPAIMYVADTGEDGRWHYVSPQIEQILGFTAAEWCADPELWAERLHPEDREWVLARESTAWPASSPTDAALEYRMLHRDGRDGLDPRRLPCSCAGEAASSAGTACFSDVTDRKAVEAELERRAAQQAAVALLGEHALEGASTTDLMHEAVAGAARMLGVEIAAVWQLTLPERAPAPSEPGSAGPTAAVGSCAIPPGDGSQAGYTLLSGAPVVVEDWDTERALRGSRTFKRPTDRRGPVGEDRGRLARAVRSARGPVDVRLERVRRGRHRLPPVARQRARRRARAPGRSRTRSASEPCTIR